MAEAPLPEPQRDQKIEQSSTSTASEPVVAAPTVATSGSLQAFRDIRRQLEEADLANPGVQRLLLNSLDRAEVKCDVLEGYVIRFHDADKRAAILEEKLRTQTALEILFAVGLGVGCAILGLAPLFWDSSSKGPMTLAVGIVLVVGSAIARVFKR